MWAIGLTALNANVHRGVLVIPVVVGAYAVAGFVEARLHRETHGSERWAKNVAIAAGCGLACLATPFTTALFSTSQSLMGEHTAMLTEWAPVSLELMWALTPSSILLIGLVGVAALVLVLRVRPLPVWDLLLCAMALTLGLASMRHLPYLALLGIGPVALAIATWTGWTQRIGGLIAIAVSAGVLASAVSKPLAPPSLGLAPAHYPERGVGFVKELEAPLRIEGPMLNEFGYGGYLIFHLWPEYPVYIDGRTDLVYPPEHVQAYGEALSDPKAFAREAERYDVQWVFLDNAPHAGARAFPRRRSALGARPRQSPGADLRPRRRPQCRSREGQGLPRAVGPRPGRQPRPRRPGGLRQGRHRRAAADDGRGSGQPLRRGRARTTQRTTRNPAGLKKNEKAPVGWHESGHLVRMGDALEPPRDAEELVRAAWPAMLRYLRHAGLGDAAPDVAQEVFACAVVRFSACPKNELWRRWLFRIATYKLKEHRRAESRQRRKRDALAAESREPRPRVVDDSMLFESMLDALTDLEREAVVLRYAVGMSSPEIADALGVPVHRVRGRLLEARRRLRRLFETGGTQCSMDELELTRRLSALPGGSGSRGGARRDSPTGGKRRRSGAAAARSVRRAGSALTGCRGAGAASHGAGLGPVSGASERVAVVDDGREHRCRGDDRGRCGGLSLGARPFADRSGASAAERGRDTAPEASARRPDEGADS